MIVRCYSFRRTCLYTIAYMQFIKRLRRVIDEIYDREIRSEKKKSNIFQGFLQWLTFCDEVNVETFVTFSDITSWHEKYSNW